MPRNDVTVGLHTLPHQKVHPSRRVLRPAAAGQQVSRSYNQDSNDDMLQNHGFVEAANPHDRYEAPALLQRIRAAEHVPHSRLQRARELGLLAPLQNVCHFRPLGFSRLFSIHI